MFEIGYELKNKNNEILATVVNVIKRGVSNGFPRFDEYNSEYKDLYVCKRPSKYGMTIVTVKESVLAGQERWTELDSVRDK